jgi:hypothetical protein
VNIFVSRGEIPGCLPFECPLLLNTKISPKK